ncbi:hypothetical protein RAA17_19690 [Komagataeibacter rhaeticus]|nr:hypothetical protein [Komagataeibacter rhaeticus]
MDENHSLNRQKGFGCRPFFRKAAFLEAFWKKPHQNFYSLFIKTLRGPSCRQHKNRPLAGAGLFQVFLLGKIRRTAP